MEYTYTVTDADGDTDTETFNIIITQDNTPSFGSSTIADRVHVKDIATTSETLPAATGGDTPLTYSLSPTLPTGMSFNATSRELSGTPSVTKAQTTYTYTVTDKDNDTATLTFKLTVEADTNPSLSSTVSNQTYRQSSAITALTLPAATSGNAPLTYTLARTTGTPALPPGLSFDASTRQLTGTPTGAQSAVQYTYTVTDADGDTDTQTFNITITAYSLVVSNIMQEAEPKVTQKATLTIVNHTDAWYYKYTAPNLATTCATVSAGTTTAGLTGLTAGTSYSLKAYVDKSGCLANTEAKELGTVTFLTKLAKTADVKVTKVPDPNTTDLAVAWTAVPSATNYKVQWKLDSEQWGANNQEATVTSGTTYTITNLTNRTDYTIRVMATNATNEGAWSAETPVSSKNVSQGTKGVTLSETELKLLEDTGSATYTVVLTAAPEADVTVTPSVANKDNTDTNTYATVSGPLTLYHQQLGNATNCNCNGKR